MIDESIDVPSKKLSMCKFLYVPLGYVALRWVDNDLTVSKEFIGLYEVKSIAAPSLVSSCNQEYFASISIGQCHDGASNMQGLRNGVAKLVQDEEPRSIFIHCYGLAAKDIIQNYKILMKLQNW